MKAFEFVTFENLSEFKKLSMLCNFQIFEKNEEKHLTF